MDDEVVSYKRDDYYLFTSPAALSLHKLVHCVLAMLIHSVSPTRDPGARAAPTRVQVRVSAISGRTPWTAVEPILAGLADDPSRLTGVTVDEHIWHHAPRRGTPAG